MFVSDTCIEMKMVHKRVARVFLLKGFSVGKVETVICLSNTCKTF